MFTDTKEPCLHLDTSIHFRKRKNPSAKEIKCLFCGAAISAKTIFTQGKKNALRNLHSQANFSLKQFGKSYRTKEYSQRELIYNLNLKKIAQHNEKYLTGEVSYTAGINQFTDLSEEEFQSYIQGEINL